MFQLLKKFLRKLLQRGNEYTKDETADAIKDCYDNREFDMNDDQEELLNKMNYLIM